MEQTVNLDEGYDRALAVLVGDGLVAIPTETVYGLAANACSADAVAAIYKAKGRPSFNPLIAHVAHLEMAKRFGHFDKNALKLAKTFWPGPLTLVLPLMEGSGVADAVTAGLDTIAMRHPIGIMARLADGLGSPLAAPSANISGKVSPTSAHHVAEELGDQIGLILDGGRCRVGVESTIVKVENDKIVLLRQGGLAAEEIEKVVGPLAQSTPGKKLEAPGMMLAHYAPAAPMRLNAQTTREGEALLAFGASSDHSTLVRNLSTTGNLDEAAHNLFAMIKELDALEPEGIAVHPIPGHGLGAAINDRLRRAAHGAEKR